MNRLDDERGDAVRTGGGVERGGDRAVAVTPEDRALEREAVEQMPEVDHRLFVVALGKMIDRRRSAITAAIREDHPVTRAENGRGVVERHDGASPAAVQTDERSPVTDFVVGEPRSGNVDERHQRLWLKTE
jgi:hypothetical protein